MIDVVALQDKIISNPDNIMIILEDLGYEPHDKGGYIQMANHDGDNSTALTVYKNNLSYMNFTRQDHGNLFSLTMNERKCSFPEALRYIVKLIGAEETMTTQHIVLPFGGFYKKLARQNESPELVMQTYTEAALPPPDSLSLKWLKDGVSLQVQENFGVRYDHESDSIIIPSFSYTGDLVGAKKRNNDPLCPMDQRWGMYLPYSKSLVVYGFYQNYYKIAKKKMAIIVEAEKSVLQAVSFGCDLCIAVGGHNISSTQAKYIRSLMCDKLIIAFDEGISQEELEVEAKKLVVNNVVYHNKVGYVWDGNKKILLSGSKNSPSDLGKKGFTELISHNVRWISNG